MKKLLLIVVGVVVVLAAVVVALPFVIPAGTLVGFATERFEAETGRKMVVAGTTELSILPVTEITLGDVSIANAPGREPVDMLRLGELNVAIEPWPLLRGEFRLVRFILREPDLALEIAEDGTPNWQFGTPSEDAGQGSGGGAPDDGGLPPLALGQIMIENGRVHFVDRTSGQEVLAEGIDVAIDGTDLDSPLNGTGAATLNGAAVALTLDVDRPRALIEGGQAGTQIELEVGEDLARTSFDGKVATGDASSVDGNLDVSVSSVAGLMTLLGQTPPEDLPVDKVSFMGMVQASPQGLSVTGMELDATPVMASGSASVTLAEAVPSVKADLSVGHLDLDRLMPPDESRDEADAAGNGDAGGEGGIDLSGLKTINVDATIQSGGLTLKGIDLGPNTVTIRIQDGRLDLDYGQAAVLDGTLAFKVGADGSTDSPAYDLDVTGAGIDFGPLLAAFADVDYLAGNGDLEAAVTATGRDKDAIIRTLNGDGRVVFSDGHLKGFDLAGILQNPLEAVSGKFDEAKQTAYEEISMTFKATNGVLSSDDILMSAPVFELTGRGSTDIGEETLDFRLKPSVVGALKVPLVITGTYDGPIVLPDIEELGSDVISAPGAAVDALTGGAEKGGGAIEEGVGDAVKGIKRLFGN